MSVPDLGAGSVRPLPVVSVRESAVIWGQKVVVQCRLPPPLIEKQPMQPGGTEFAAKLLVLDVEECRLRRLTPEQVVARRKLSREFRCGPEVKMEVTSRRQTTELETCEPRLWVEDDDGVQRGKVIICAVVMNSILGGGLWVLAGYVVLDVAGTNRKHAARLHSKESSLPQSRVLMAHYPEKFLRADWPSDATWVHEMLDATGSLTVQESSLPQSRELMAHYPEKFLLADWPESWLVWKSSGTDGKSAKAAGEQRKESQEPSGPGAAPPPAEAEAKKEPEPAEVAEAVQASEPPQAPAVAKTQGPDALADRATEERSSGEPKQMPDAPAPVQREPIFEHLPSVGAWLTPLLASPLQDASPAEPGAAASLRREPVFEHLPSVGAWLTPLLASPLQMRLAASDLGANAEAPVARQDSFFPPAWPAAIERRPPPPEAKEMDLNVLSTHPAGPKYSMAPLIGKKSGSDEVGPGKYAEVKAEQDKYSKPPCWSIGNPAKDGLWGADSKDPDKLETAEIDESGVPGPGQYFPVDQSPYSPKFGFGSRRKDPKPATCPGPGQYELKSTLQGKSGPSWGKPPPDSGRGKGKDGKSTEPGPGEFSPNSSITSRSAPAIGFSASNREKASVSDSPGPGQYDLATTLTGGAVVIRSPTSASIKEEDNTIAGPGPPTSSFRSFSSR